MSETPQPTEIENARYLHEGVCLMEGGVNYLLPKSPFENFGLMTVLDLGGKMPDQQYNYGEA